ncbi:MAG: hypothetical protein ACQEQL_02305, partial [Pseudomonadota bacterium]
TVGRADFPEGKAALYSLSYWIISQHKNKRRNFEQVQGHPYNPETKFIRLTHVGDVQTVLNTL